MSKFHEETKAQEKLTSHNCKRSELLTEISENNLLLANTSTEPVESKNFSKINKEQVITTEKSNFDSKSDDCEKQKKLNENWKYMMIIIHDDKIEEAYNNWVDQPFFVKTDYRKLYKVFKNAAKFDHPIGQYYLAMCYYTGTGCKKSLHKAAEWSTKALFNGWEKSEILLKQIIRDKSGGSCTVF